MTHWSALVLHRLLKGTSRATEQDMRDVRRIIDAIQQSPVYLFRNQAVAEVDERLSDVDTLDELSREVRNVAKVLGFDHYALFVLNAGSGVTFAPKIFTSYSQQWISRYVEKEYQYVDPVMNTAKQSEGSFLFSDLNESCPLISEFWRDAVKHGVGRTGICFVETCACGSKIGLSFASNETNHLSNDQIRENSADAEFLGRKAISIFADLAAVSTATNCPLSVVEIRFLYGLSRGLEPKKSAYYACRTSSYQDIACKVLSKMNVETEAQAVSVATANGWFEDLPYSIDEISNSTEQTPLA